MIHAKLFTLHRNTYFLRTFFSHWIINAASSMFIAELSQAINMSCFLHDVLFCSSCAWNTYAGEESPTLSHYWQRGSHFISAPKCCNYKYIFARDTKLCCFWLQVWTLFLLPNRLQAICGYYVSIKGNQEGDTHTISNTLGTSWYDRKSGHLVFHLYFQQHLKSWKKKFSNASTQAALLDGEEFEQKWTVWIEVWGR